MDETITTTLWKEEASEQTPFRPRQCLCAGYDVYADLMQHASAVEYLYLLFKQEQPGSAQTMLLNRLVIAVANAGPRDHGVQAAMSAGAGGAGAAASLMAAVASGAGSFNGAKEIYLLRCAMDECRQDFARWQEYIRNSHSPDFHRNRLDDVWPAPEHVPGFDSHIEHAVEPTLLALKHLADISPGEQLAWLQTSVTDLEAIAGCGVSLSFVAAAALHDLDMDAEQSEMLFLWLRLLGAGAHAIEQRRLGWQRFPFYTEGIGK